MRLCVIFREYNSKIICLFPEVPGKGSNRPRDCLLFSDDNFTYGNYDAIIAHSKPVKAQKYRSVLKTLSKRIAAQLNIINYASQSMHDQRHARIGNSKFNLTLN